jgi:hypothetical protein
MQQIVSLGVLTWFLEAILSTNENFQGGEKLILFQIGLFSQGEETHASFDRKPSVLESGESSTFIPVEH